MGSRPLHPLDAIYRELTDIAAGLPREEAGALALAVSRAKRVFLGGMGRSGLMMRAFAMRLMQLGDLCFVQRPRQIDTGNNGTKGRRQAVGAEGSILLARGNEVRHTIYSPARSPTSENFSADSVQYPAMRTLWGQCACRDFAEIY